MSDIAKAYESGEVSGWLESSRPGIARAAFSLLKDYFTPFKILGQTQETKGQKMFLHDVTRAAMDCGVWAVPDYYKQEIGDPFVAGTKVLMADGSEKNIEDIEIGDQVLNHKLEVANVTNVIKKNFTGDLVTIAVNNFHRTVTATESHHGMVFADPMVLVPERKKFGEYVVGDYVKLITDLDDHGGYFQFYSPISEIVRAPVIDEVVYCITTENEWSAIFNGIASYQCVSFGAKHGTTFCSMVEIFKNGEAEKWRPVHPSYYYGTGRIYEGHSGGYEDGSVGSWMAAAVMKWGSLFADEPGVPKYSGQLAKQWGADSRGIDKWKDTAMPFTVKSATQINSWDELVAAIVNGYACPTASSIGYSMEPSSDGFHRQTTNWNHQMCFFGVDDGYKNGEEPYALLLNNWDDCFSSDTEVLTKRGWQLFSELEPDEEFATLNTESWKLEYQKSTERQRKFVSDGMVSITGRDIDMLVTPNHRVYMCSYNDDKQNSDNWGCVTAQSLPKHFYVKKNAEWDGEEIKDIEIAGKTIDADTWFEFMGYFLAEGCSSESYRTNYSESKANIGLKVACAKKQRVYTVSISQNEPSANIESCLRKLPFTFSKWQLASKAWSCRNQKLGAYLKQFGKSYEKFVPDYIKNGSKRQIQLFFDAMMFGDGTTGNGAFVYYTSSRRLADDMQELALKIGLVADIVSVDRVGRESGGGTTRHIEYRVGIKRQQLMQHVTHEAVIVPYEDFVNCVTVPNGTLYVRRNGKASWCGNCHGHLKDFDNGSALPYGILRVRRRDAEKHIRAGETYAYSQFQGMPEQRLDRSKFKFI